MFFSKSQANLKFEISPKKIQTLLWVHRPSKSNIDFLEMPTHERTSLSLDEN